MKNFDIDIKKILWTGFLFLLIDGIYLTSVNRYFQGQVKEIQGSEIQMDLWKLILTYIILILGYYYFVVYKKLSFLDTFLLGLFIYAVYEFTNYSLFKKWKWTTVVMDTLWGGILFILIRTFA